MTRVTTAIANASQGLTCFHEYQDRKLKTLTIDMLYTSLAEFTTETSLWHRSAGNSLIASQEFDTEQAQRFLDEIANGQLTYSTKNSFDADVGLASSASGFASLTVAAAEMLNLPNDLQSLSKLARRGSFSASASITGGISVVRTAGQGKPTYAELVFDASQLEDLSVVVAFSRYEKANHDFYQEAQSSPVIGAVRNAVADTANQMIRAFENREVDELASLSERHAILNYSVLQSGKNLKLLWKPETLLAMEAVRTLRTEKGLPLFYSMNTGANVFVYCFGLKAKDAIESELHGLGLSFRTSKVGHGARLVDEFAHGTTNS